MEQIKRDWLPANHKHKHKQKTIAGTFLRKLLQLTRFKKKDHTAEKHHNRHQSHTKTYSKPSEPTLRSKSFSADYSKIEDEAVNRSQWEDYVSEKRRLSVGSEYRHSLPNSDFEQYNRSLPQRLKVKNDILYSKASYLNQATSSWYSLSNASINSKRKADGIIDDTDNVTVDVSTGNGGDDENDVRKLYDDFNVDVGVDVDVDVDIAENYKSIQMNEDLKNESHAPSTTESSGFLSQVLTHMF